MIELNDPCTCEKIRKPDLTYFCPYCWRHKKGKEKECLNANAPALAVNTFLKLYGTIKDTAALTVETKLGD